MAIIFEIGIYAGCVDPDLRDGDLEKECIRKLGDYTKRQQRVFSTDRFGPTREKRNSFALASSGGGEGNGLGVAKLLLLFQMSVRGDSENCECLILQYV